jgi:hypothetical protein
MLRAAESSSIQRKQPYMTKASTPHVIAVLKLPKSVHDVSAQAKAIVAAVTGNSYLPTPSPATATITADTAALDAAETVALTKVKGAVAERNVKLLVVRTDLTHLKGYVQQVADANPTNADAIITSAGMSIRKTPVRVKQAFVAKQGSVSGSADLVAKSAGRASYDWESSPDQKTWTLLPSTLQAHTTVPNLTPGATVYFRSRPTTKVGQGDWSQIVSLIVK